MWVGEMISDINQAILLVTEPGREEECMIRLSRVGYDNTIGYLEGGFASWEQAGKETDSLKRITGEQLEEMLQTVDLPLFDVRKKSEFDSEHLLNSTNIPLNQLNTKLDSFPKEKSFVIYCAGGYRSMIAASILKQRGFDNFIDVSGGFNEIAKTTQLPKTTYVCPSTLL
jgi:rhodanese-related sulfurtransferase